MQPSVVSLSLQCNPKCVEFFRILLSLKPGNIPDCSVNRRNTPTQGVKSNCSHKGIQLFVVPGPPWVSSNLALQTVSKQSILAWLKIRIDA